MYWKWCSSCGMSMCQDPSGKGVGGRKRTNGQKNRGWGEGMKIHSRKTNTSWVSRLPLSEGKTRGKYKGKVLKERPKGRGGKPE